MNYFATISIFKLYNYSISMSLWKRYNTCSKAHIKNWYVSWSDDAENDMSFWHEAEIEIG